MDIDQRLDRLTDRHEALTQSVELLVAEGRETGKRVDKLAASVDSLVNIIREHERRIHRLEGGEDA
jgi:chromosome segregation ATPase